MTNSMMNFTFTRATVLLLLLLCGVTILTGCGTCDRKSEESKSNDVRMSENETEQHKSTLNSGRTEEGEDDKKKSVSGDKSERPNGYQFRGGEKLPDKDENVKVVIEDDAVFRRVDIMGKYVSVFCGKKLFDALQGKTITAKLINELLAEPNEAEAKAGNVSEDINDYPFHIEPQLIVDRNTIESELQRVGVLNSERKPTGNKKDVTVTIHFSTYHQAVMDILHADIRKSIPAANVQVMPYKSVQLVLRSGDKTVETGPGEGDLTGCDVTFTAPGNFILSALNEGRIAARYYIPASYYKRNLSVATVEILGKSWDAIEEAIKQNDSGKTSTSNVYTGIGLQATIKVVPIKFGFGSTNVRERAKIDKWIMKEHLQTICMQISANASTYGYTEFIGATPEESKLPGLNELLMTCFPDEKKITVKFDEKSGFSYTPSAPDFVAVAKEQLKETLAANGIRDEKIVDDSPMKVQLGADVLNKITELTQSLSYTFHHITDVSIDKAVNIRRTKVDFQPLVAQRDVGPVIVSDIIPAKTRDEDVSFEQIFITGATNLSGGDYAMSRAKEGTARNQFLLTSGSGCLAQGNTTFHLEGEARWFVKDNSKNNVSMQIRYMIGDKDTTYLWSRDIEKEFLQKPEEQVLGIFIKGQLSPSLSPYFSGERIEGGYNSLNTSVFDLRTQGNLNDFFSVATATGDSHKISRYRKDCYKWWHWDDHNIDDTFSQVSLTIIPRVKLQIQTEPKKFVFGRPQPLFRFIFKNGKFQPDK